MTKAKALRSSRAFEGTIKPKNKPTLVACDSIWVTVALHSAVLNIHEMLYLQRCLVVTWRVSRETAAVSAQVLCTPYNHSPVYSVTWCMCVFLRQRQWYRTRDTEIQRERESYHFNVKRVGVGGRTLEKKKPTCLILPISSIQIPYDHDLNF